MQYNYIAWIISIVSVFVAVYSLFHKENHEDSRYNSNNDTELKVSIAKQNTKLDMLLADVGEIKITQRSQNEKIENLVARMVKVEQSTKSAHHRLDRHIGAVTREEEET